MLNTPGKRILAFLGGGLVYGTSTYAAMRFFAPTKEESVETCSRCSSSCAYDALALDYDRDIGWDEAFMGLNWIRWWMMSSAKGKVLEISAGTGRNLTLYPSTIDSVVATDVSFPMIREARRKLHGLGDARPAYDVHFLLADAEQLTEKPVLEHTEEAHPRSWWQPKTRTPKESYEPSHESNTTRIGKPALQSLDSQNTSSNDSQNSTSQGSQEGVQKSKAALPYPELQDGCIHVFQAAEFDTVVDTFGLCSCEDPVRVLKQVKQVLKDDGRIVLLEHGRSSWDFINNQLDNTALSHNAKWGCWWNRDILGIVQEAGLKIESVSRWHFGTTYCIIASSQ